MCTDPRNSSRYFRALVGAAALMSNSSHPKVLLPLPVYETSGRYYVFDPNHVAYLRAAHRIPGSLIGTLPQSPQQNVFSGMPLYLMPEEARLLVETGVAFVLDDVEAHSNRLKAMGTSGVRAFRQSLERQGMEVSRELMEEKEEEKHKALQKVGEDEKNKRKGEKSARAHSGLLQNDGELSPFLPDYGNSGSRPCSSTQTITDAIDPSHADSGSGSQGLIPHGITPTTSYPPLPFPKVPASRSLSLLPDVPPSYALFKYLHTLPSNTYFMSSGLRFGCQYVVYPGDPLRFHSHFLACGFGWDEEIDLLTLVGGGRLGTGVKKGFLIGGEERQGNELAASVHEEPAERVKTFCIEWSSM